MSGWHAVVVGAGGNIGSHLVPHLARLTQVAGLTLIDRDVYTAANVRGQAITPREAGRRKAIVQAGRARAINPALRVAGVASAVEDVPLGRLRGDVILACLDSRVARQTVNRAARRLGVPWIDAGVDGGALLARVDRYLPGETNPCLECAWDERDYANLEQAYTCTGEPHEPAPTNAPSSLGGLAAALQALECQELLAQGAEAEGGWQVVLDARHQKHYVTRFRRNPSCRLADHGAWSIHRLERGPREITLGRLRELPGASDALRLRVEGRPFVARLACRACRHRRSILRLLGPGLGTGERCGRCGETLLARGFDIEEDLDLGVASRRVLSRPLASVGLRPGDVFTLTGEHGDRHFEIAGDSR